MTPKYTYSLLFTHKRICLFAILMKNTLHLFTFRCRNYSWKQRFDNSNNCFANSHISACGYCLLCIIQLSGNWACGPALHWYTGIRAGTVIHTQFDYCEKLQSTFTEPYSKIYAYSSKLVIRIAFQFSKKVYSSPSI